MDCCSHLQCALLLDCAQVDRWHWLEVPQSDRHLDRHWRPLVVCYVAVTQVNLNKVALSGDFLIVAVISVVVVFVIAAVVVVGNALFTIGNNGGGILPGCRIDLDGEGGECSTGLDLTLPHVCKFIQESVNVE